MNYKKLIVCVAAFSVCVSCFPWCVNPDIVSSMVLSESESTNTAGFSYVKLEDGSIEIKKYTGDSTTVNIPETIDGCIVSSIGRSAFSRCNSVSSILIPEGVKSIGQEAFSYCSKLKSVIIPKTVTSIGQLAFASCKSLQDIIIPEGVTSIESGAFYYCSGLAYITIPESVINIGEQAFSGCGNLNISCYENSIVHQFAKKYNISYVTENTEDLLYEELGDGTVEITGYKGNKAALVIPKSIDGKTVSSIGDYALRGKCVNIVTLPESITNIGNFAFYDCQQLLGIALPEGVKRIGEMAFCRCYWLDSVTLPKSLTSIGSGAFYNCSSLSGIIIPNSIFRINGQTFYECKNMFSITIPKSVENIGNQAFFNCNNLTFFVSDNSYAQNFAQQNDYPFEVIDSLDNSDDDFQYIGITDGTIETLAIIGYEGNNTEVVIPKMLNGLTVSCILDDSFKESSGITSITIPDSITWIGKQAFSGCDNIVIFGYENSYTQKYAEENGIQFEVIGTSADFTDSDKVEGDVDGNGSVSVCDFIELIEYIVLQEKSEEISAADLNNDGEINSLDVLELKKILLRNSV